MNAATETTQPTPLAPRSHRVVQRTIIRPDQELDVRALYLSGVSNLETGGEEASRQAGAGRDTKEEKDGETTSPQSGSGGLPGLHGYGSVTEAGHAVVEPHRRVTFATYFNAFPASYWRRWTDFPAVRLEARLRGDGNLVIYRSTSKGHVLRVEAVRVQSPEPEVFSFDLPLKPFIDGGWYWFDIEAEDGQLVLEDASWSFETDRQEQGRVSIGITTFNRPDFCVAQLDALGDDPRVLELLDEVIVVDQGTSKVEDDPGFAAAAAKLGDHLRLLTQPNLGGSGGFSRAMNEAAEKGASDYVLLLDDDVVCELEGILRAVAIADLAKQPVLVGGQMFSLYDRTVMHAYGETLGKWRWFWGPAPSTRHGHNFAQRSLRSTSWLHRRIDVDYNGWWMCLIPLRVVREIGLSLPMFIKWDDAEFGLRAGEAGFPTVTMPGVAVWHVPWTEKDDTLDWQAYFHERNRVISGLLHSPYERGGRLVLESLENLAKRTVSMQYSTAESILLALQDVLDGPERMHRDMIHRLKELRVLREQYTDGRLEPALDDFPKPALQKPPKRGKLVATPQGPVGIVRTAATALLRQLRSPRELAATHPEAIVPHVEQRWWRLAQLDSSIVSTADGTAASWYKRDRKQFMELMQRSARMHAELYRAWPELARRYREALPGLTAPEKWKQTFEGVADDVGAGQLPESVQVQS